MQFDYIDGKSVIATIGAGESVNVMEDFVDSKDVDNKVLLEKKFIEYCQKKNYYPKKVTVIKTIIFVEEKDEKYNKKKNGKKT